MKKILLSLLMVGAQSRKSAIEKKDLAERSKLKEEDLDVKIDCLIDEEYIKVERNENEVWIYLTPRGVVAASSIYS
ncbi:MAG: hypothetical protein M1503_03905 [Thaumarchaeota archaeon]|nr:hypothetical protein [Nitrososphaerota archaeon]MCL5317398.1 hypothetical protein [Nitrososphaerota archaeon]